MPAISVIVPVYKVEKYIHRCVDSVLGQTFADFELILVDDGSPDNCGAICDEYAAKDSRVRVIHQENGGLSAARNTGIDWSFANSDSRWLTFIDSDDWVHPEYLQRLLDAAVEYKVSVSICGFVQTEGEEPDIDPEALAPVLWTPEDFYVEHNVNATVAWGKLYCKECFRTIRYPVGKIHEDEFVTYRVSFQLSALAVIRAPMYFYYTNPDGITKAKWRPQRLHALEAIRRQVAFLKDRQYEKAYRHALKKYMTCLSGHIFFLEKEDRSQRVDYIPKLRRELRRQVRKHYRLIPLDEFPGVYETAFPCFMYVFWIVRAQVNKIKRKFR